LIGIERCCGQGGRPLFIISQRQVLVVAILLLCAAQQRRCASGWKWNNSRNNIHYATINPSTVAGW